MKVKMKTEEEIENLDDEEHDESFEFSEKLHKHREHVK